MDHKWTTSANIYPRDHTCNTDVGSTQWNSYWHVWPRIRKNFKEAGQVRDRRTAASSITAEKEWADHTEETQENTKCDFQIEQLTKIKNTEGKYQESCTNVETPNTKQKVAKGSQNNEDNNITQHNQQNKLPVPVATEQKELEALKLCKTEIK